MVRRVLDTNVLIKWFVQEDGTDRARAFLLEMDRGVSQIIVPSFLFYEFSNTLWVKRRDGLTAEEAGEVWARMIQLPLEFVSTTVLIPEALSFSFSHQVSPYDAIFVILARHLGCELITADFPLWSKVRTACLWVKRL
ncbi:MAG TPA: type II toxin-antitoxin system VapC family toxin [Thermoanaerobaculia bacterium]|nr:type II toxin-antitoxin system VapC family toxin [Thermoanaerobaculia bacterium]